MNEIGATGKFPNGKLNADDEGELAIAVAADKKKDVVLIEFGKPINWFGMNAEQAEGLAVLLKAKAAELKPFIPDEEKQEMLDAAFSKIKLLDKPVKFEMDITLAFGMIAQLQLAFRHPENVGATRQIMEKFVRDLIEDLDPAHGEIYQVLMAGFNEAYDL